MSRNVDRDLDQVWNQFHATVNMTSPELRAWLLTSASGEEAFGPDPDLRLEELGRGVLHVLGKRRTDLTPADAEVMSQVVRLVEQWLAEPPSVAGAVADSDGAVGSDGADGADGSNAAAGSDVAVWRHRLMSVGHDPLKD